MGSLHNNLSIIAQSGWKDRITLLHCIVSDLEIIHSRGFIHRDLHSGNILLNNLHSAYIADLGYLTSINTTKNLEKGIYGVLPYIAPEVLNGNQYTTASDVYSFGMIMWEILYGRSVSYNQKLTKLQLQFQICDGLRPFNNKKAPRSYVNLMKECWNKETEKRPSVKKLCEVLKKWQEDEDILLEFNESETTLDIVEESYMDIFSGGSKFIPYTEYTMSTELEDLTVDVN
ncbi:kinase-like domain-containing protein [Gigaspora rosea]|uniref:Kinase-like domain-containing protein n=1 Tax=Gigaspora rosea TaxID=44941 RepID=A0A397W2Y9_9GLOM|nr:kinase-like domain-containing protein [Gigaspora rosea]